MLLVRLLTLLYWICRIGSTSAFQATELKKPIVPYGVTVLYASSEDKHSASFQPLFDFEVLRRKRVLVVGGSGRVGGSVVKQLIRHQALVTVGGRRPNGDANYVALDRDDLESMTRVLQHDRFDLVIHTAGPFQGRVNAANFVLEAAIAAKVPYVDVCDDYCTAMTSRSRYHELARAANVPCIISTGCWPGVSNLMALQLLHQYRQNNPNQRDEKLSMEFSFFTAGSGGAGVTLLVATFLILSEQALVVVDGRRQTVPPMVEYRTVDFGRMIGSRQVADLNLLETAAISENLQIPNVRSRFGTAPDFWNELLGAMARWCPPSILANEEWMRRLSVFSMPIVRLVDRFAGATNAMRCDLVVGDESVYSAIYGHDDLQPSVAECVVSFACALLAKTPAFTPEPGIWFPEQAVSAGAAAQTVLYLASVGAHTTLATVEQVGPPLHNDASIEALRTNINVWGRR
jgi:Saccharopine dehydrogenase NADP binding domain